MGKPTSQNTSFINHFSHPHRLQLTPSSSSPPCSACKLAGGNGRSYSCRPCNFSLHESCSKMKQVIKHPSHPSHNLNLLVAPVYDGGCFNCDACGVNGTGFSYQCSHCDFDIHALCAYKPLSIIHKSHPQHDLKLAFYSPYGANKGFSCDICLQIGKNQWLYRCILCEFDAHVGCVTAASPPPQPHLQHSTSAPTPHTHHARHPQHRNSLPGSNRPRPMPMSRPNRPMTENVAAYGPRRQNNLDYNAQVGPIGPNEVIGSMGESFGQGSMDGSGYDGSSVGNEEFDVEVNLEVEYEGDVYEGDVGCGVPTGETNEDEDEEDDVVAYGDDYVAACSESEFGGSSDARSQCNDISDADLYPVDNTQGPVRMNQNSGGGRNLNLNLNGPTPGSKNMVLNGPRGRSQGSKSPVQSPRGPQTRRVANVRNNVMGRASGPVSVRVNRLRQPLELVGPQGFNGPSGGPSNVVDSGGNNNNNYNEVDGTNMYVGEDNVGYNDSYGDEYVGGDGDCDFEAGGDDGYGQDYDENDFESYSDFTGGSESMYGGDESYGTMDDSQYSGLNDEPNNQYLPMVGPTGGPGINNQIQYGQTGRPRNMGMNGRGGATNMNRYGNNQYRSNGGPYRVNGRPNMMNGGSIGPNGSNGLGNVMMNAMVQSLTGGFAMNMLNGGGGDVNGGTGDGGVSSILGGLFGGESGDQTDLQF
ncbi:Protein VACUOLELESS GAMETOPHYTES [Cardamine amara subsp. amara]|uniref:Protein VACUOLELESS GAMETOPHYTES n=1 Tax=Cardamine amara subsp. amara TaxID=228776 RepID=A0ABD1AJ79_CARAN